MDPLVMENWALIQSGIPPSWLLNSAQRYHVTGALAASVAMESNIHHCVRCPLTRIITLPFHRSCFNPVPAGCHLITQMVLHCLIKLQLALSFLLIPRLKLVSSRHHNSYNRIWLQGSSTTPTHISRIYNNVWDSVKDLPVSSDHFYLPFLLTLKVLDGSLMIVGS